MKKTSKIISIILSLFMLMQMMGQAVLAESNCTASNLKWDEKEIGTLTFDNSDKDAIFYFRLYKDNEEVESTYFFANDKTSIKYGFFKYDMVENGSGSYHYTVENLDADYETISEPVSSDVYQYNKMPELGKVTNIKLFDGVLRWDTVPNAESYEICYGFTYGDGEFQSMFSVTCDGNMADLEQDGVYEDFEGYKEDWGDEYMADAKLVAKIYAIPADRTTYEMSVTTYAFDGSEITEESPYLESGVCGNGTYFGVTKDGVLKIMGTGSVTEEIIVNADISVIWVDEGITEIQTEHIYSGNDANYKKIKTVVMPSTLTKFPSAFVCALQESLDIIVKNKNMDFSEYADYGLNQDAIVYGFVGGTAENFVRESYGACTFIDIANADKYFRNIPSAEYRDSAKIMYDLGYMRDIYFNYNKNVTEKDVLDAIMLMGRTVEVPDSELGTTAITYAEALALIETYMGYKGYTEDMIAFALDNGFGIKGKTAGDTVTNEELSYMLLNAPVPTILDQSYVESGLTKFVGTMLAKSDVRITDGHITYNVDLIGTIVNEDGKTEEFKAKAVCYDRDLRGVDINDVTLYLDGRDYTNVKTGIYSTYRLTNGGYSEYIQGVDTTVTPAASTSISLTIGQTAANVNGQTVHNDVAPKIVNDRTMLPIAFVAEALGAKVEWFGDTRTVQITGNGMEIAIVIGESFAAVNGQQISLDSPAFIENDRTYMPLNFIASNLGADVKWDGATRTVSITK